MSGYTKIGINALAFSLSGSTIFAAGYIQGSIDGESASGLGDGWVTEFNLAGTRSAKSVIYGSSSEDAFEAINVDFANGNIWVTGWIKGTAGSFSNNGGKDGVYLRLSPSTLNW